MIKRAIEIYKLSQRNRTLSQNNHANCHMKNNLPLIAKTTYRPGVSQTCYTCRRVRTLATDSTYYSYRLHLQLTIKLQLMITWPENDQYLDCSMIAGKVSQIKNNESPLRWKVKKPVSVEQGQVVLYLALDQNPISEWSTFK